MLSIPENRQIQDLIAISTIIILYQLIPFIRSDGYWIISDLTDTLNLLPSSSKKIREFLKNPFKFKVQNRKDWLILLYGLSNQISNKNNISKHNADRLSERQTEIVNLVKKGLTNKEIAEQLFISENTVKYHLKSIYTLLGIDSRNSL